MLTKVEMGFLGTQQQTLETQTHPLSSIEMMLLSKVVQGSVTQKRGLDLKKDRVLMHFTRKLKRHSIDFTFSRFLEVTERKRMGTFIQKFPCTGRTSLR